MFRGYTGIQGPIGKYFGGGKGLIRISRNIRITLENRRGLFMNILYSGKVSF